MAGWALRELPSFTHARHHPSPGCRWKTTASWIIFLRGSHANRPLPLGEVPVGETVVVDRRRKRLFTGCSPRGESAWRCPCSFPWAGCSTCSRSAASSAGGTPVATGKRASFDACRSGERPLIQNRNLHRSDGRLRFGNRIAAPSEGLRTEDDRFVNQLLRGPIRICCGDAPRQVRYVGRVAARGSARSRLRVSWSISLRLESRLPEDTLPGSGACHDGTLPPQLLLPSSMSTAQALNASGSKCPPIHSFMCSWSRAFGSSRLSSIS